MKDLDFDFEKDAGDQLVAMNSDAPWFNKAARLAGQQLEWLMPVVMGEGRGARLYAGKAVMGNPGTVVFVCSNENKLCTVHLTIEAGGTAKQVLDDIAKAVGQRYPDVAFTIGFAAGAMRTFTISSAPSQERHIRNTQTASVTIWRLI
jgi:hypothetical protein